MITVLQRGTYRLVKTKTTTRILILDGQKTYVWQFTGTRGQLTFVSSVYTSLRTMSSGNYRLYTVDKEKNIADGYHVELYVGRGIWNGYLLPSGLPKSPKQTRPILPTSQVISVPTEAATLQASSYHGQ